MKIFLRIPEAFRGHYERDKFEDSLKRILDDIKSNGYLSGNYEIETLEMLIESFGKSQEEYLKEADKKEIMRQGQIAKKLVNTCQKGETHADIKGCKDESNKSRFNR